MGKWMTERTASWLTLIFAVTLQGLDYGIIIPSMLNYMTRLNHGEDVTVFFGVVASVFSLSSLVTAPFFGWAFDKYSMKYVLLVLTAISLIGSAIYALAVNNYMVLIGRILCGAGYNIFPGASLFVVQITTLAERSSYFAKITMAFSISLALGPAFNFPLSKVGFHQIGPFEFSEGSAPGWVMVILFLVSFITFALWFQDPVSVHEKKDEVVYSGRTWQQEWKMLFSKVPCTVLIFLQFLVLFTQTTVEVMLTPLTKLWYDFDASWNSILFTGMVGVIIAFLVLIHFLTQRFQDRTLLMVGHLVSGLGNVLFVVCLVLNRFEKDNRLPLWQFCIVCATYIAAIAFYQSILGSLFSKLLNDKGLDGRGQSILSGASSLGSILGPLVSTSVMGYSLLFIPSVMAGLWSIGIFLLIACWDFFWVDKEAIEGVEVINNTEAVGGTRGISLEDDDEDDEDKDWSGNGNDEKKELLRKNVAGSV